MHIKSMEINGFKSYANRTEINGFDPSFNAITGLNGSGKSNILDALCFVFGISQLSHVRVANLQGLIYKQGQAGVTSASVSVTFDNTKKEFSPIGYEDSDEITITRKIVVGGTNKYLINGHNAQATQVQNLFHSVQLNVNNPHFLIMQGRITQVLNMKPVEILGLLKEAAGVNNFDAKRNNALKKIEQKQTRVDEIKRLLEEEIQPRLTKLQNERTQYLIWTAQNAEAESLNKYIQAYSYYTNEMKKKKLEAESEKVNGQIKEYKAIKDRQQSEEIEFKKQIESQTNLSHPIREKLKRLSEDEAEVSKKMVKEDAKLKNFHKNIEADEAKIEDANKQLQDLSVTIKKLFDKLQKSEENKKRAEENVEKARTDLDDAQRNVQSAKAGISRSSAGDGDGNELLNLQQKARDATTQISFAKQRLAVVNQKLQNLEKEIAKASKNDSGLQQRLDAARKLYNDAQLKMSALVQHYSQSSSSSSGGTDLKFTTVEEALALRDTISQKARADDESLRHEGRMLDDEERAINSKIRFEYQSPYSGFDRSSVKGVVAELIHVKEATLNTTAIEIVAGGKLYNVVVDTVATSKELLKNGKLRKRYTIIPLDKIRSYPISEDKLYAASNEAKKLGGKANLATDLVTFDEDIRNAIDYVFGSAIICDKMETARAITFHRDIQVRTVTLEGDSFDPRGTLTGGSLPPKNDSVLNLLEAYSRKKDRYDQLRAVVMQSQDKIKMIDQFLNDMKHASYEVDSAKRNLTHVENEVSQTELSQLQEDKAKLEAERNTLNQQIVDATTVEKESSERVRQIELDLKNRETMIKKMVVEAEKLLEDRKKILAKSENTFNNCVNEVEELNSKLEDSKKEEESLKKTIVTLNDSLIASRSTQQDTEKTSNQYKADLENIKYNITKEQEKLKAVEDKITELTNKLYKSREFAQNSEVELKNMKEKLEKYAKEINDCKQNLDVLLVEHPWIQNEKKQFGKEQTEYDFNEEDVAIARNKLKDLEVTQAKLAKEINKRAISMLAQVEKEYNDLAEKRSIIEKDKHTIEAVIEGLDRKKNETLQKTWEKVNKDFGSIFASLLPNSSAKLEPEEGKTMFDGLEVKVAFGKTWKDSLTELSGGQRSLLALSLILAMLLYKPAPVYILDEVDAALDLSHTQNIGIMIRKHFSQSQFIVVSLKEGMFNNANVIFKTKFVEGVSTVTRIVPQNNNNALKDVSNSVFGATESSSSSDGAKDISAAASKKRGRGGKATSANDDEADENE